VHGEERYTALVREIQSEFPGFRIVRKDTSRWQRGIAFALKIVTFGGQRAYLTDYQTTLGSTVYVTSDWDELPADDRYVTLRHELVHIRQFRRYTFPGMAILYLLLPLPLGLAWFRARFEKQAYAETIRAAFQVFGETYVRGREFQDDIVSQFTSGAYGWMWPFRASMAAWVEREVDAAVRAAKEAA